MPERTCHVCGAGYTDSEESSLEGIDLCPDCLVSVYDPTGKHRARIVPPLTSEDETP